MAEDAEALDGIQVAQDTLARQRARLEEAKALIPAAHPGTLQQDALGHFVAGNTIGAQFQPGQTGNPNGAPKHKVELTKLLTSRLEQTADDGRTWAQRVTEKLISMAESGNVEALRYLMDRIEGKPTQAVSLSLDEGPLHYRLAVRDGGPRLAAAPPGDAE